MPSRLRFTVSDRRRRSSCSQMCAHHSLKGCSALTTTSDNHMNISASDSTSRPPGGGRESVRTSPGAKVQGSNLQTDETSSTATKAQLANLYYARSNVQLTVSSSVPPQLRHSHISALYSSHSIPFSYPPTCYSYLHKDGFFWSSFSLQCLVQLSGPARYTKLAARINASSSNRRSASLRVSNASVSFVVFLGASCSPSPSSWLGENWNAVQRCQKNSGAGKEV